MCLNRPAIDNLNQDVQEYIVSLETNLKEQNKRIADLEIMLAAISVLFNPILSSRSISL